MRRGFANRVDGTAKALIAAARSLGFEYHAQDGSIDGVLWMPATRRVWEVDWKTKGGDLTPAQARLVAQGWQIRFVSDVAQLEALAREGRG